jgi:hypothetical protein
LTKITFARNAMMSQATLTDPDGGRAFVFCSIPGGRPWFTLDPNSQMSTPVSDAPSCDTDREFRAFVRKRFADAA